MFSSLKAFNFSFNNIISDSFSSIIESALDFYGLPPFTLELSSSIYFFKNSFSTLNFANSLSLGPPLVFDLSYLIYFMSLVFSSFKFYMWM